MLKLIFAIRKYIIAYMFLMLLFIAGVFYFTSVEYWKNPIFNLFSLNGFVCLIIFVFLYVYIKSSLISKYKQLEITFIDDIACFIGTISLLMLVTFVIVYQNITGIYISLLKIMFILLLVVSPLFCFKFLTKLCLWFWRKVMSLFITVSISKNLIEKDKTGELTVSEAMNSILITSIAREELDIGLNIGLENNELDNNELDNIHYNLLSKEHVIKKLNKKWALRKNIIITFIIIIFGILNLINTIITFKK